MSEDPSRRGPGQPGRLWTEPREGEERQRWLEPPPRIAIPEREPPLEEDPRDVAERERRRRRRRRALVGGLAAIVVGASAFAGGMLAGGSDAPGTSAAPLARLPGAAPADQRSRTIRSVYAAASPSVVFIRVAERSSTASGTGFIVDGDGTIVTNAHVVGTSQTARVRLKDGGRDVDAEVLGTDASSDLAVLRISREDAAGIKPLALADSDDVQVGDLAVAIGYPLGLDRTATAGIVSGTERRIEAPNGFQIDEVIQTDAPVNPGNSGGPLLDSLGRVIGVNSQIATAGGGGSVGIGFAVPSNTVREIVPRLERDQSIRRAYLGVSTAESPLGPGAVVATVNPSGPADTGGLRPGDVIHRVEDKAVRAPEDVNEAIERLGPGDEVDIEVERGGERRTLQVTLGTRPERTP